MTTKTSTRTIVNKSNKIVVKLERGTYERENRLDGMLTSTDTILVNRTEIAVYVNGSLVADADRLGGMPARHNQLKEALAAGCTNMIGGKVFVKAETASAILAALEELDIENPKTDEMLALEAEEKRIQERAQRMAIEAERLQWEIESHPGYCKKCHSYCYGDCEA
jgi:hypothetical protein